MPCMKNGNACRKTGLLGGLVGTKRPRDIRINETGSGCPPVFLLPMQYDAIFASPPEVIACVLTVRAPLATRFRYLFLLCQRVRFRSFLCFFLRIFLRRFFTTELTNDHLLARFAYTTCSYYTIRL